MSDFISPGGIIPALPWRWPLLTILAGSDAGPFNSYVYPGFSLHSELQELVRAGLSPVYALRTATILPAEFMGLGGELGQIAEGYRADRVLLSANPFEDIANTQAIASVILRGETVLDAVALRGLLRSVAR